MSQASTLESGNDWTVLTTFLPSGWQEKAKETGALLRCRKFANPEDLLRVLFIHLAEGSSLRVTAAKAKHGNIASVSDVALLKRLNASGEWFRWMACNVMSMWIATKPVKMQRDRSRIRIIDGTTIQEPGATGATWRIHYSFELSSLRCNEILVTDTTVGESFANFSISPGDLLIGDRCYCQRSGIHHVVTSGGNVLLRVEYNFIARTGDGSRFDLFEYLRSLKPGVVGDWDVLVPNNGQLTPGRICAVKKSKEAAERSQKEILKKAAKKGRIVKDETLEAARYIILFTTLDRSVPPLEVLETYRDRWQVEIAFKRMKSLLGLGHLRKTDLEGAKAWIHGKLLVAFLLEAMMSAGSAFFPWGYPLPEECCSQS